MLPILAHLTILKETDPTMRPVTNVTAVVFKACHLIYRLVFAILNTWNDRGAVYPFALEREGFCTDKTTIVLIEKGLEAIRNK